VRALENWATTQVPPHHWFCEGTEFYLPARISGLQKSDYLEYVLALAANTRTLLRIPSSSVKQPMFCLSPDGSLALSTRGALTNADESRRAEFIPDFVCGMTRCEQMKELLTCFP
jgi:hypothetical protein